MQGLVFYSMWFSAGFLSFFVSSREKIIPIFGVTLIISILFWMISSCFVSLTENRNEFLKGMNETLDSLVEEDGLILFHIAIPTCLGTILGGFTNFILNEKGINIILF